MKLLISPSIRMLIGVLFFAGLYTEGFAKPALLPKGVGLYQLGYRSMPAMDSQYNQSGEIVPLGSKFNKNFDGENLIAGKGGPDLQKLGNVLQEFDGGQTKPGTLSGDINLGKLSGDVAANVDAKIFGLAFGVTDWLTLFGGIPYISAAVDTQLHFDGSNNALEIRDRLGEVAFSELKDGLERASRLNTDQIKQNIYDAGYQSLDHWENTGVGDLKLGAKTGGGKRLGSLSEYNLLVTGSVDVPTGYVERPDILTDVSFGKGYYSLGLGVENELNLAWFLFGVDGLYALNLPTEAQKRVPLDQEELITADRTTTVQYHPGDDSDVAGSAGIKFGWITSKYRMGQSHHFGDRYSGSLDGNYSQLGKNTDTEMKYQQVIAAIDSSSAYSRGSFPIPFILNFKAHLPLSGHNIVQQKYYEMNLTSFFSTPLAERRARSNVSVDKPRRRSLASH